MRLPIMSLFAIGLAATAAQAVTPASDKPDAIARLKDANGAARGSVGLTQTPAGIAVKAAVTGLPAGVKGIHIHAVGKCDAPKFETAGSHWNPTAHQHGTENPQGPHKGDMKNITVGADGAGALAALIPDARLKDGPNALMDTDGAAIVVHGGPDDYKTDPSGNSGGRIACGVVTPTR